MNYLDTLNAPQREAVTTPDGPLMIIAGAGSGKTRVLTYKIAFLIEHGIDPFRILALTFTNKAAKEMRERIEAVVGTEARNLWMGTFHAVFAKILRFDAEKLGYQSNFTIYDAQDSKSLLKSIIKEKNLDEKRYRLNSVFSKISAAKNALVSPQAYREDVARMEADRASGCDKIVEIYAKYVLQCFRANAMDFDDLLLNTHQLLTTHLDVLSKYQRKFQYLLIDEFQDTNRLQYEISRKLAALHQNICVVGDDAQSIYAFRGADIGNILNFERDYDDLKIVKLEQNYRSSNNIVGAANSIIRHNTAQLPKKVWTDNTDGFPIVLLETASDREEGRAIASSIFEEKMRRNLKNNDFAVLYRTNAQSRALEEALRKINIPYKIIGGLSFYQRKEVKDLLAYLKFIVNPQDVESFKRIINYPKRGIGQVSVQKILVTADQQGKTVWDVISNIGQYFKGGRMPKLIEEFVLMIDYFRLMLKKNDAYAVANTVAQKTKILSSLYEDESVEGKVRYDNVQELINSIKYFVDNPEVENKSLEVFLQEVALMTSSEEDHTADSVTLMTIHMSKGLEFDTVYLAGLEENLFPSQMMLESREDLEEERRLCYVAITRAKQRLTLSYAKERYRFGIITDCVPSRFIDEIDPKYLQKLEMKTQARQKKQLAERRRNFIPERKSKRTKTALSPHFKPTQTDLLEEGMRVEHSKFGMGRILKIEPFGTDRTALVDFEKEGVKKLILSFAKLMAHEN